MFNNLTDDNEEQKNASKRHHISPLLFVRATSSQAMFQGSKGRREGERTGTAYDTQNRDRRPVHQSFYPNVSCRCGVAWLVHM